MMTPVFADSFTRDLDDLLEWINARNPVRARTFVAEIKTLCREKLAANPQMGSLRPNLGAGVRGFHSARHRRTIFYRIDHERGMIVFQRLIMNQNIEAGDFREEY